MLHARAYSLRQKSRLAISLSWIAGYSNVVVLIQSGMMISHVTGNLTHLGEVLIERKWHAAMLIAFLPICFLLGAMVSGICVQVASRMHRRSIYIIPMTLQAALLGAMSIVLTGFADHRSAFYLITGLGSAAMGMQNATITSISGAVVRTTHLTGVVTDIGTEIIALALWLRDKTRRRGTVRWKRVLRGLRRQVDARKLALLISIVGSFVFGVLVGTFVYEQWPRVGLIPPVLFLLFIIIADWREPIADVKEVDRLSDPELRGFGIDPATLPASIAIYRVAPALAGVKHHAPDFSNWAADVPRRARTCILSLAHGVTLDADACLGLKEAGEQLAAADRELILAGVTPADFDQLELHGVLDVIPPDHVFPDLEFALATRVVLITTTPQSDTSPHTGTP